MATIVGKTGGAKTRAVLSRYPADDGLTGGTTSQEGHELNLVPEEKSNVANRYKRGL